MKYAIDRSPMRSPKSLAKAPKICYNTLYIVNTFTEREVLVTMDNNITRQAYDQNSQQRLEVMKQFMEVETQKPMELTTDLLLKNDNEFLQRYCTVFALHRGQHRAAYR